LSDPPAVHVRGLLKQYGDHRAVDHLDLEVPAGEFFGFLGPNGAGKTTTIRMLTGLLRPDQGTATVAGIDVVADPIGVKACIGVLPEEPVLYERLTGREMLWFAGRLHGLAAETVESRTDDLLRLMGLSDTDAEKLVVDCSLGMRKKIGLAAALLHRPRVLFLDEPFNGIDAVTSRGIYEVLREAVRGGMTVFFTSHVLEVAESLCTRLAIIHDGRIRAEGTLDDVRRQAGVASDMPLADLFVDLVEPGKRERATGPVEWLV
jgi:ABC-2 type transport system ATP-binding protein